MVKFPETALREWTIIADAAGEKDRLRHQIDRDARVAVEVERLMVRHEASEAFQQALDAAQTPPLDMQTLTHYKLNPAQAPADLIDGVLKEEGLCVVLGPSGTGKSTLALQMAHSLLSGTSWLGQATSQIQGGVGIMSYDMDASLVFDWASGMPNVDSDKISVVNSYRRGNPLSVREQREQIAATWRAANTEVIIIDSFSASFFGHDQNDAAATMNHYRDLKLFALTECGATSVVVITHSTEGSPHKARGSSVHHDVADSMVSVVKEDTGSRTVQVVKYRAARGQTQMKPVVVTAPDSVTHLVGLDYGAMALAGMELPPGAMFKPLPKPIDAPDFEGDDL